MTSKNKSEKSSPSRRDFLKCSGGVLAGAALSSAITSRAYAAEDNTIKVALVGCGGRGTGAAANALSTAGPTKLWAMADVFEDRVTGRLNGLKSNERFKDKIDVPKDRQCIGFDGFKKAIDAIGPGGVVCLATPPAFRPQHFEYAVEKGCNVFMEKSFAVDGPGIKRVINAGEEAEKKNLKVAGGLMSRHSKPLQAAIEQIHQGAIGDVITCWAYREHGPVGFKPRGEGVSELAHQIRNYSNFTWLNGTFLLDWLIHNIDVCCWVKDAWPVSAQGQGGRQTRQPKDQMFDHFSVEYSYPDGTRMLAQGRHQAGCWGFFGDVIHGSKGSAVLGEGIRDPKLYKGFNQTRDNQIWKYEGEKKSAYQIEHDVLFEAIRQDKPHNETDRCAKAAMAGILGRMAAESGKKVTWEDAMESKIVLAPGLDEMTMDSEPPVKPDADGNYPIAIPGITKAV